MTTTDLSAPFSIADVTLQTTSYPPAAAVSTGATELVSAGWDRARSYADTAYHSAVAWLADFKTLADRLGDLPNVDPNLGTVALDLTPFESMVSWIPTVPGNIFSYTENAYTSALLTQLQTIITAWVAGTDTGLPPAVEQAIWERGRARELTSAGTRVQQVQREFASRGFSKPPGAMAIAMQAALQEAQNANSTSSREVMIKQADLEQSNRRFAMEHAWKIEEGLINYTNLMAARAFEKAKYLQQVLIDIFKVEVEGYASMVQAYAARVGAETAVFKAEVDMNIAEANIRIEAAKANIQRLVQEVTLLVEAVKGGAQVSSQLAASALSGVNLSAAVHDQTSNSSSNSVSASANINESLQYAANANYNYSM